MNHIFARKDRRSPISYAVRICAVVPLLRMKLIYEAKSTPLQEETGLFSTQTLK